MLHPVPFPKFWAEMFRVFSQLLFTVGMLGNAVFVWLDSVILEKVALDIAFSLATFHKQLSNFWFQNTNRLSWGGGMIVK